tara:strand:+ start:68 stop:493 length:426 start_codon:yes stop_codon:yes gene_type:complete
MVSREPFHDFDTRISLRKDLAKKFSTTPISKSVIDILDDGGREIVLKRLECEPGMIVSPFTFIGGEENPRFLPYSFNIPGLKRYDECSLIINQEDLRDVERKEIKGRIRYHSQNVTTTNQSITLLELYNIWKVVARKIKNS